MQQYDYSDQSFSKEWSTLFKPHPSPLNAIWFDPKAEMMELCKSMRNITVMFYYTKCFRSDNDLKKK